MRYPLREIVRSSFLVSILLLGTSASAQAGLLINGDFSQDLTGWTVTGDAGAVSIVGGAAVLRESGTASEVGLFQDFTIPLGIQSLSFVLVGVGPEDDYLLSGFGAALLDPNTHMSLVDTVDAFTDSFYTRDLDSGTTLGMTASGVTVSSAADTLPLTIRLDVSALGGQEARILFRIIGGGDTSDASATVDDVTAGVSAVPEPSGLILLASGMVAMAGSCCLRRSIDVRARGGPSPGPAAL